MDIVELYTDESFNNLLDGIASKKKIKDFDDYRQDVFVEILDTGAKTRKQYANCANRIASRYYRSAFQEDIYNYGINEDGEYYENEDDIMSRLIYHGKASKAG
jgi:hypothetical protein